MPFPTSPGDGDLYTTANGTQYQYVLADDKWVIVRGVLVFDISVDTTPTLGGELDADGNKIVNLGAPTIDNDAATKKYVDDNDALQVSIADIDNVPVDAEMNAPISSNWAFDHDADADAHHNEAHTHTHASTTGQTANDHHNEVHTHTHASTTGQTASDHHAKYTDAEAVTATSPHLMIGSANAAWVPCPVGSGQHADYYTGSFSTNIGAGGWYFTCDLPLPTNRGGKKLYIDGIRVAVWAANATNYINQIDVYGLTAAASTVIYTEADNQTSTGLKEDGTGTMDAWGAATDCSGYLAIRVVMAITTANAGAWGIAATLLSCYYN